MKKRLAKVLALGLTAAMVAGAPLSAMASEVNAADQAGNTAVAEENTDAAESAVEEAEETPEAEADAEQGIATQDLIDSNYVPVENGVDPMSLDGLVPLNDGNWYYFEHGAFQSYRGLYPNSAGWWYLDRGKIDFSYNGVYNYGNSQWYVQGGQIQFGYTGPAEVTMWDGQEVEESIYYISNGQVDYNFTGLVQATLKGENAWWYFEDGQLAENTYNTLSEYGGSWWYVEDGKINFNYEGIAWYNGVEWYVRGGRVDFSFTGRVEGDQEVGEDMKVPFQTYFVNGMQQLDLTGVYYTEVEGNYGWYGFYEGQLASRDWYYGPTIGYVLSNASGWWYIDPGTGLVDFTYTGMAENDYGTWYMSNGQLDFSYNGFVKQRPYGLDFGYDYYDLYAVTGGKADCNYDGIIWADIDGVQGWYGFVDGCLTSGQALMKKDDGTWWYVGEDGMVDFTYTGRANTAYGYYYVENGQINFGFSGTLREFSNTYECYQNGRMLDWDFTGLVQTSVDGEEGWYYVSYGTIYHDHDQDDNIHASDLLVQNEYGWWAVINGKVAFDYNGLLYDSVNYSHGYWFIRNGQIDFSANGFIQNPQDDTHYIYLTNGYMDYTLYTVAEGTINGETGWWCVNGGGIYPDYYNEGYAAYGDRVWYFNHGKVDFNESGTFNAKYIINQNDALEVKCEVVNGQVLSMTAEIVHYEQPPQ